MSDVPNLPPESLARIEIARFEAIERLQAFLKFSRYNPGEDAQVELCIAYADYVRDVYFAQMDEFFKQGLDQSAFPSLWNHIAQQTTLSMLPNWKTSGGLPEWKDFCVECAFKSIKASPRYKELLRRISTLPESPPADVTPPVEQRTAEPAPKVAPDEYSELERRALQTERSGISRSVRIRDNSVAMAPIDRTPPELPQPFQDEFEAARAQAELDFSDRGKQVPENPSYARLGVHGFALVQNVFFAYCSEARKACRHGHWTVSETRRASEAASTAICDYYFVREHGETVSEESKSKFRTGFTRILDDDERWKVHRAELIDLTKPPLGQPASHSFGSASANSDVQQKLTDDKSLQNPAAWTEIEIRFISDERVQIITSGATETRNYAEMGCADRRSGKPNVVWLTFRQLAELSGIVCRPNKPGDEWTTVEKGMQGLRRKLRVQFKVFGDPVPFVPGVGYKAQFKISCSESFEK
ncbi:MAG: hypothetical protein ACR2I2_18340 [Bryobacteraceae bacterium]